MTPRRPERPDVGHVLQRLKGFQRDAVEMAFERLYIAPDSTNRFLVADEVGLGKTLIARGIIARAVHHMWNTVERIDVVYLCSNAQIARQNIRRLNPFPDHEFEGADRITMLPVTLSKLTDNKLNFVAFTPGTSLDLKSSQGQKRERALLYWLLHGLWPAKGKGALNLLQGLIKNRDRWRAFVGGFREQNDVSSELERAFHRTLENADARQLAEGEKGICARWHDLCSQFRYARDSYPREMTAARKQIIGELRALLARACVDHLEPDLVILDEFQRFKHLLTPEDGNEAAQLAKVLFEWQNEKERARVLLLSATPYKMYTLGHEQDEDSHYDDFLRTVDFLEADPGRSRDFRFLLKDYRRELYRLADGGCEQLVALKHKIESALRRVMSRTERIGAGKTRDGMTRPVPSKGVTLTSRDVKDYVRLQDVADQVGAPNVVDFWKSAPYLLNFMEEYRLKQKLREQIDSSQDGPALVSKLAKASEMLLDPRLVTNYEPIDPANARMRGLVDDILGGDLWRCLWLPPSLPSYQLEGPFSRAASRGSGATKRLIFSAWAVVPKTIAALLTFEVERRIFQESETSPRNTPEDRKRRAPLLRFARSKDRLTGMPVLTLIYPSPFLARAGDLLSKSFVESKWSLDDVTAHVAERVSRHLGPILEPLALPTDGPEDESWYWRAPLLLDRAAHPVSTKSWWDIEDLSWWWTEGAPEDTQDEEHEGDLWEEHVEEARSVGSGEPFSPGRPPGDLALALARLALAGPANAALRALWRVIPDSSLEGKELRLAAGKVAWAFRALFNRPESIAIIRGRNRDLPYWRSVLRYSLKGDLDAVLTEHAHVVRELYGYFDLPTEKAASGIASSIVTALSIRASRQEYQSVHVDSRRGTAELQRQRNLRGHFAMRFTTDKSDDDDAGQRGDVVRDAFNSPFWPFVLATTSIGQEGLDFHAWCHAVVHWNLPANPVDLEQREGRVHRFKGHAIRKNVARAHGCWPNSHRDPWESLFKRAHQETTDEAGGLIPYWLYEIPGGAYIERYAPALPLSKDQIRLEALRKSLAVYRMVFGQPRQDDLLAYLVQHVPASVIRATLDALRIDLSPRPSKRNSEPSSQSEGADLPRRTASEN